MFFTFLQSLLILLLLQCGGYASSSNTNELSEEERLERRSHLLKIYNNNSIPAKNFESVKSFFEYMADQLTGKTVISVGAGSGVPEEILRTYGVKVFAYGAQKDMANQKLQCNCGRPDCSLKNLEATPHSGPIGYVENLPDDEEKHSDFVFGNKFDSENIVLMIFTPTKLSKNYIYEYIKRGGNKIIIETHSSVFQKKAYLDLSGSDHIAADTNFITAKHYRIWYNPIFGIGSDNIDIWWPYELDFASLADRLIINDPVYNKLYPEEQQVVLKERAMIVRVWEKNSTLISESMMIGTSIINPNGDNLLKLTK